MIDRDIKFLSKLGKKLFDSREVKGIRRESVSKILGISVDTIRSIERGERPVSMEELIGFADIYNKSINYFIEHG